MCNVYFYLFKTKYFIVTLAQQPQKTITNDHQKKKQNEQKKRKFKINA